MVRDFLSVIEFHSLSSSLSYLTYYLQECPQHAQRAAGGRSSSKVTVIVWGNFFGSRGFQWKIYEFQVKNTGYIRFDPVPNNYFEYGIIDHRVKYECIILIFLLIFDTGTNVLFLYFRHWYQSFMLIEIFINHGTCQP